LQAEKALVGKAVGNSPVEKDRFIWRELGLEGQLSLENHLLKPFAGAANLFEGAPRGHLLGDDGAGLLIRGAISASSK
jgi:hypothetical protein